MLKNVVCASSFLVSRLLHVCVFLNACVCASVLYADCECVRASLLALHVCVCVCVRVLALFLSWPFLPFFVLFCIKQTPKDKELY